MKPVVYFDPDKKIFWIDGEPHKLKKITSKKKSDHISKDIMEKVDIKDYNQRLEEIVSYIKPAFSTDEFLFNILQGLPMNEIEKLELRMKKAEKVEAGSGCYFLKAGGVEIPLVE